MKVKWRTCRKSSARVRVMLWTRRLSRGCPITLTA
jgi:hypothetical protein